MGLKNQLFYGNLRDYDMANLLALVKTMLKIWQHTFGHQMLLEHQEEGIKEMFTRRANRSEFLRLFARLEKVRPTISRCIPFPSQAIRGQKTLVKIFSTLAHCLWRKSNHFILKFSSVWMWLLAFQSVAKSDIGYKVLFQVLANGYSPSLLHGFGDIPYCFIHNINHCSVSSSARACNIAVFLHVLLRSLRWRMYI